MTPRSTAQKTSAKYLYNRRYYKDSFETAELAKCSYCKARKGRPCKTRNGNFAQMPHTPRIVEGKAYVTGVKVAARILPTIK